MPLGDIVDELHNEHCLAHACASEETDLATLAIRLKKVDHLYTGIKNLRADCKVIELGGWLMYGAQFRAIESGKTVNGITDDVEQTTFHLIAGGDSNRTLKIVNTSSALETVGTLHSHTTYGLFTDMLLHFEYQFGAVGAHYFESSVDGRDDIAIAVKHHVDHRSDHLDDFAIFFTHRDCL